MDSAKRANRRYFRQAYRTGRHGWAAEQPSPYAVAFLQRIKAMAPGGRLLDVGCGEGRHAIAAAELGFRVTAVDYEPLALKRARRFARMSSAKAVSFRRADVLHLPLPDRCFDVVLDFGCLHHQRKADWQAYKANLLRVLKPRGFYVLSVFSPRFHLFQAGRRPWHVAQGAYRRCFTPADITGLFGREFDLLELTEEKGRQRGFWHALMQRRAVPG